MNQPPAVLQPTGRGQRQACGKSEIFRKWIWFWVAGAVVDVSDQPVPPGVKLSYSSATDSHEGIDLLGDAGVLYAGERARLHAALESLRA
jgi:hypothetical protein